MPLVKQDGSQVKTFALDKIWDLFSENPQRRLLLLGDAGMGKTSTSLHFCKKLWESIQAGESYPLPLYIYLPQYKGYLEQRLLWRVFKDAHLSDDEQIAIENCLLWLVLDGFDEVPIEHNIYETQEWGTKGLNIGMLVCCRPEVLTNRRSEVLFRDFENLHLQKFSKKQIKIYINEYLTKRGVEASAAHDKGKDKDNDLAVKEYLDWLRKLPSLKMLVKTPFLLQVLTQTLPAIIQSVSEEDQDEMAQRNVTQNELFHVFLDRWFSRQAKRVKSGGR